MEGDTQSSSADTSTIRDVPAAARRPQLRRCTAARIQSRWSDPQEQATSGVPRPPSTTTPGAVSTTGEPPVIPGGVLRDARAFQKAFQAALHARGIIPASGLSEGVKQEPGTAESLPVEQQQNGVFLQQLWQVIGAQKSLFQGHPGQAAPSVALGQHILERLGQQELGILADTVMHASETPSQQLPLTVTGSSDEEGGDHAPAGKQFGAPKSNAISEPVGLKGDLVKAMSNRRKAVEEGSDDSEGWGDSEEEGEAQKPQG